MKKEKRKRKRIVDKTKALTDRESVRQLAAFALAFARDLARAANRRTSSPSVKAFVFSIITLRFLFSFFISF